VPYLKLSAVHDDKAGTLTLFCLNRHLSESMPLEVSAKGFADLKVKSAHQLCDKDLTALNTKDNPERIKPAPLKDAAAKGATLSATLAPASWSVIRLG
jgi:alpha-N-arabinofuranosidase